MSTTQKREDSLVIVCDHHGKTRNKCIGDVELLICDECAAKPEMKHGFAIKNQTESADYFRLLGEYWEHTPESFHDIPNKKVRARPWKRMSSKGEYRKIGQGHIYTDVLRELK